MTFGSKDTYELIGRILEQSEAEAYNPLLTTLYADIRTLVWKYAGSFEYRDREDLIEDAVIKVLRSLPAFYRDSGDRTEAERNAWLRTVVINARNDLTDKLKKEMVDRTEAVCGEDADGAFGGKTRNGAEAFEENTENRIVARDRLFDAMYAVFRLNTTADRLIAFVYNKLFSALAGGNGSPRGVKKDFDEVSIRDMYEQMVTDLREVLGCEIPEYCLEPLKKKVEEQAQIGFHLSERTITDSSSWITGKMKEQYKDGK